MNALMKGQRKFDMRDLDRVDWKEIAKVFTIAFNSGEHCSGLSKLD